MGTSRPVAKNLLVIGGGGHGRVVAEAAVLTARYEDVLVVDDRLVSDWQMTAFKCISESEAKSLPREDWRFIIAVGDNNRRKALFETYKAEGFAPATLLHPDASISQSARIGAGSVVLARCVIGTLADVGEGVIVNNGAIVEHDCVVESFAHLAPGAVMCGGASLGAFSFLGANSAVKHLAKIGAEVTIGHASAVTGDITEKGTYAGNPAKEISSRHEKA